MPPLPKKQGGLGNTTGDASGLSVTATGASASQSLAAIAALANSANPTLVNNAVPLSILPYVAPSGLSAAGALATTDQLLVSQNSAINVVSLSALAAYLQTLAPSGSAPFVTVTTPADQAAATTASLSGTYGNSIASPGIDYQILNQDLTVFQDWTTATGVTFNAGAWSGLSVSGLGAGYYKINVRLSAAASATASTGFFGSGNALLLTTPANGAPVNVVAGTNVAVSGKFNTAAFTSGSIRWQFAAQKANTSSSNFINNVTNNAWTNQNVPAPAAPGSYQLLVVDAGSRGYATLNLNVISAQSPVLSIIPPNFNSRARTAALVLSGYYGGGTLDALDYQFDSSTGTWLTDATTSVDGKGNWTVTIPAPTGLTAGSHTAWLRWRSNPTTILSQSLTFS